MVEWLHLQMHVHQLDVSNSFCYARIEGDVYRQPTPDYQLPPGHCFKLEGLRLDYETPHARVEVFR